MTGTVDMFIGVLLLCIPEVQCEIIISPDIHENRESCIVGLESIGTPLIKSGMIISSAKCLSVSADAVELEMMIDAATGMRRVSGE